ncbi:MAG TPA: hypothetical protein PKY81_04625 [bacterium]|nr:hypothetical protein [bacterium]HPN30220.1 hypothetical protein [bacterium]
MSKFLNFFLLAAIILFVFRASIIAGDKVFVDDYISAEAPVDAFKTGLGSVDIHDEKNASAVLFNPSLLSNIVSPSLTFNQSALILDASYNSFFYMQPFYKGGVGFAYLSLELHNKLFVETDNLGFITSNSFKVGSSAYILSYGQKMKIFKRDFNLGLSLRYLNIEVGQYSNKGYSALIAANYKPFKNAVISHSISNFASNSIGDDKMPLRIKNSLTINLFSKFWIIPEFENVENRFDYRLGIKYDLLKFLNLGAGYSKDKFSMGVGLNYSDFTFNYAFQTNKNKVSSEAVSSIGISWNIGYNRKIRITRYKNDMSIIKSLVDRDENYDRAVVMLNDLKNILDKKKDEDEFYTVESLSANLNNLKKLKSESVTRNFEEHKKVIEDASKLVDEKNYDLAKNILEKIDYSSDFYDTALKLLMEIEKKYSSYQEEQNLSLKNQQLKILCETLDNSKDIFVKIDALEKIIEIDDSDKNKKLLEQLRAASQNFVRRPESLVETFESKKLIEEALNQRSEQNLKNAVKFFNEKNYEFAKYEIEKGREFLNDSKWQSDLMNKINAELAKIQEEKRISNLDFANYNNAVKYYASGEYQKSLQYLNKILNRTPEIQTLIKNVADSMKKQGYSAAAVVISKTFTKEELELIEQLFIQGKQLYIAEKFSAAKEKWKKILQIDPDNEKAKRYLKMIE